MWLRYLSKTNTISTTQESEQRRASNKKEMHGMYLAGDFSEESFGVKFFLYEPATNHSVHCVLQ